VSKGGVTKKLDDTLAALDKKELKKALYLTENNPKLERQHQYIMEAARICLANKENKQVCDQAIREARNKVHGTISLPIDDTSLEGLEEYMTEQKLPEEIKPVGAPPPPVLPEQSVEPTRPQEEKTDEELYEECEPCHVAVAASRIADICAEKREEAGSGCEIIGRSLENEDTEPADWIKTMIEAAEKAQGEAKEEMTAAIAELTEYLERRNSPLLKTLDKEENHAQTTIIPPRAEEPNSHETISG